MYELLTSGSPFPLYTGTRVLFLQSSGIQHYLTILLIRSGIHLVTKPPDSFITITTPVAAAAFQICNQLIAVATFYSKMRQQGISGQHTSPSQSFYKFSSFSIYFLHISFIPSASDMTFPTSFFIHHTLMPSLPSQAICLSILK